MCTSCHLLTFATILLASRMSLKQPSRHHHHGRHHHSRHRHHRRKQQYPPGAPSVTTASLSEFDSTTDITGTDMESTSCCDTEDTLRYGWVVRIGIVYIYICVCVCVLVRACAYGCACRSSFATLWYRCLTHTWHLQPHTLMHLQRARTCKEHSLALLVRFLYDQSLVPACLAR